MHNLQHTYNLAFDALNKKNYLPPIQRDYLLDLFYVYPEQTLIYKNSDIEVHTNKGKMTTISKIHRVRVVDYYPKEHHDLILSASKEIIQTAKITNLFCEMYYAKDASHFLNALSAFAKPTNYKIMLSLLALLPENFALILLVKLLGEQKIDWEKSLHIILKYSHSFPQTIASLSERKKAWQAFEQIWKERGDGIFRNPLLYSKMHNNLAHKQELHQRKI